MRRAWILVLGAGLFATGLGCSKTCQHTAGVCDCCPPPVESLLTPYAPLGLPPPLSPGPVRSPAPPLVPLPSPTSPTPPTSPAPQVVPLPSPTSPTSPAPPAEAPR